MPSQTLSDPSGLGLIVSREQALAAGLTRDQIRHRVRSARWTVIATGMYLRSAPTDDHDAMHARRAVAAAQRIPGAIIIGASAAAVHKLPLVHPLPQHVELSVPPGSWRGIRGNIRRRALTIDSADLVDGPVHLTSVARTFVDVARERPLADALSVGDAAVRRNLGTHDDVARALQRAAPIKGLRNAARAFPHIDSRRESALESWSAAQFIAWGIPLPEVQVTICDDFGLFIARVDFFWREFGVIGEADGLMKYSPDEGGLAAFGREKDRESALRDLGYDVIRWRWADLASRPLLIRRRLEASFIRARKRVD